MLHLIFQWPADESLFLTRFADRDHIILLANASYAAIRTEKSEQYIEQLINKHISIHILADDLLPRGLNQAHLVSKINIINYVDFVRLTESHAQVLTWN